MTLILESLSTEYVRAQVAARLNGAVVDPTGDTVEFAFLGGATSEPAGGDWVAGSWETDSGRYYARCLVGPTGDKSLTDGLYHVWLRITDTPEVVVRKIGKLSIK